MSPIRPRLSQWVRSDEKAEHVQQQVASSLGSKRVRSDRERRLALESMVEHPLVEHPQVRRCPGHNIQREGRKILAVHHKSVARARARGGVAHALFEEIMKTVELACMLNSAACFMLAVLVFLLVA